MFCVNCGEDITEFHAQPGPRRPCPNCGDMVRRIEGRVIVGVINQTLPALTQSATGQAGHVLTPVLDYTGEAIAPTIETAREIAAHFDHLLRMYPPTTPGDVYVIELVNPDIGLVGLAAHEDRTEAFRQLADDYTDDT